MMDFGFVLISVVTIIVLFPYIRCFFKRLICAAKIKRMCQGKSLVIHPTHPLWFLGNRRARNCDLYIETPTEVLSVKLFGAPRRLSILIFKENGNYFFRSYIVLISYGAGFHIPIDGRDKKLPEFDFRYKYQNTWNKKSTRNILLTNPAPIEFRYQPNHGSDNMIGVGDTIKGVEISSLQHLLKTLEGTL